MGFSPNNAISTRDEDLLVAFGIFSGPLGS